MVTAVDHPYRCHCGYLRRSEITTWASDRSKPSTVKVTMETSGAGVGSPIKFTLPMIPSTESQKLWN